MHNPLEEFLKKTIFLVALGYLFSTTETFQKASRLFDENQKVFEETRASFNGKASTSSQNNFAKSEVKTNTR